MHKLIAGLLGISVAAAAATTICNFPKRNSELAQIMNEASNEADSTAEKVVSPSDTNDVSVEPAEEANTQKPSSQAPPDTSIEKKPVNGGVEGDASKNVRELPKENEPIDQTTTSSSANSSDTKNEPQTRPESVRSEEQKTDENKSKTTNANNQPSPEALAQQPEDRIQKETDPGNSHSQNEPVESPSDAPEPEQVQSPSGEQTEDEKQEQQDKPKHPSKDVDQLSSPSDQVAQETDAAQPDDNTTADDAKPQIEDAATPNNLMTSDAENKKTKQDADGILERDPFKIRDEYFDHFVFDTRYKSNETSDLEIIGPYQEFSRTIGDGWETSKLFPQPQFSSPGPMTVRSDYHVKEPRCFGGRCFKKK